MCWPPSPPPAPQRGLDVYLCTSDKDCRQLIDDRVRLYSLRKRQVFGREELLADWGVKPEQVVDLQTLVGDSVDNVPGVPGIGIKTAAKLLQEFGTLENILANIDRIPGPNGKKACGTPAPSSSKRASWCGWTAMCRSNFDWDGWRLRDMDVAALRQLFQEWGFHGLANQAARRTPALPQFRAKYAAVQGELFPFGANAPRRSRRSRTDPLRRAKQPPSTTGRPSITWWIPRTKLENFIAN